LDTGVRDSSRYCSSSDFEGWLVAISERYISSLEDHHQLKAELPGCYSHWQLHY
jgi:hypothetical protein